jgi:hypothetical protein
MLALAARGLGCLVSETGLAFLFGAAASMRKISSWSVLQRQLPRAMRCPIEDAGPPCHLIVLPSLNSMPFNSVGKSTHAMDL